LGKGERESVKGKGMNLERGAASLLDALLGGREIKYGELERGEAPHKENLPLSCGTPCQERGIQGVR